MGRRKPISNWTVVELKPLANAIWAYIKPELLHLHASGWGWHVAGHPAFFEGHREFLRGLEDFLVASGLETFVPLPKWDPTTTIPPGFDLVKVIDEHHGGASDFDTLVDTSPNVPLPVTFSTENLKKIASTPRFSLLAQPWHNLVHQRIGGAMANIGTSPRALVFWIYHAFVDDELYENWLEQKNLPEHAHVTQLATSTTGGGLYHTVRTSNGRWSLLFDITATAPILTDATHAAPVEDQPPSTHFRSVAAAGDRGAVQLVVGSKPGELIHTIRAKDRAWAPFGNVKIEAGDRGETRDVACAATSTGLHVLQVTAAGGLFHAIRDHVAMEWTPLRDVKAETGDPGPVARCTCATIDDALHVVVATKQGKWLHAIRAANGEWSAFGDVGHEAREPEKVVDVAVAGLDGVLHALAVTSKGALPYSARNTDAEWTLASDVVKEAGDVGKLHRCAATAHGGSLHVACVGENHKLWHTIRWLTDRSWQAFGDVEVEAGERGDLDDVALASVFMP